MTSNDPTAMRATSTIDNATVSARPVAVAASRREWTNARKRGVSATSSTIELLFTRGAAGSKSGSRHATNPVNAAPRSAAATTTAVTATRAPFVAQYVLPRHDAGKTDWWTSRRV